MTRRSRKQERLLHWNIVLNTSVIVASIGWGGYADQMVNLWKAGRIQLVLNDEIVDEYLDVVARWVPEEALPDWQFWFSHPTKVTRIHSHLRKWNVSRDVTDNKFVDVAVAGDAKYIVTRDNDLLSIGEFRGVRFLGPKEFLTEHAELSGG